jgi:hypothetical protein
MTPRQYKQRATPKSALTLPAPRECRDSDVAFDRDIAGAFTRRQASCGTPAPTRCGTIGVVGR